MQPNPPTGELRTMTLPTREDVTEHRMAETYSAYASAPIGAAVTATEQTLLAKLPAELEIGFVSKALLYSPAIRHVAYSKPERTALFKLLKRGLLRVERDRTRDMEYLTKTVCTCGRGIKPDRWHYSASIGRVCAWYKPDVN